jgi:hypothetical protein
MLNLFNNTNNYSFLDNNLLNYGLIVASIGILGYSMYYFSGYMFKNYVDSGTQTSSNNLDIETQTNLDILDKDIQTMSNNLDANIQTLPNIKENFAQTYDALLIEKIQEV